MKEFEDFIESLTDKQRQQLSKVLNSKDQKASTDNDTDKPPITSTTKKVSPEIDTEQSFRVDNKAIVSTQTTRRKEAVKAKKNEWSDTGEFKNIHTPDVDRSPRRKEPPKKIDLECHVCGRVYKEDPRFVYGEFYRCNRCTN